jgi:hypothetical protein
VPACLPPVCLYLSVCLSARLPACLPACLYGKLDTEEILLGHRYFYLNSLMLSAMSVSKFPERYNCQKLLQRLQISHRSRTVLSHADVTLSHIVSRVPTAGYVMDRPSHTFTPLTLLRISNKKLGVTGTGNRILWFLYRNFAVCCNNSKNYFFSSRILIIFCRIHPIMAYSYSQASMLFSWYIWLPQTDRQTNT